MNYQEEFKTVDLIVSATAETRGVDAFALSLIKAERQIRRLVTHLVFQSEAFNYSHILQLRGALADNRRVYFLGFVKGFDALYTKSLRDLIGNRYDHLVTRLAEATDHRNKLFHGQLTSRKLTREELLAYVDDIREWCRTLASSAQTEVGYDGFARQSFQKTSVLGLCKRFRLQLARVADYKSFIKQYMQR